MYVVGLTGGIGSGKSTVLQMLAARGAEVLDADAIVHELQQPGEDAHAEIVEAFGPGVLAPDGTLDRAAIASIVFADAEKREVLNAITHPKVGKRFGERLAALRDTDKIVVLDIPLLGASKSGSEKLANAIVVVTASEPVRLDRLEMRGLSRDDAAARIAAQITDEERLKLADYVLENNGSVGDLEKQVDELWEKLRDHDRVL
jgi:dephospho-CoA kinase